MPEGKVQARQSQALARGGWWQEEAMGTDWQAGGSPWASGSTSVLRTVLQKVVHKPLDVVLGTLPFSGAPARAGDGGRWTQRCLLTSACNHQYCWVCVSTGKVKKAALLLREFKRFGDLYDPLSFPAHCLVVLSGCFPQGTVLQLPFLGLCLWICKQQSPVEAGKVPEIKHPILLMKYSLWESLQVMLWLHISCNCFLAVLHFLSQVNFKGSR